MIQRYYPVLLLCGVTATGCQTHASYVKTEQAALGRVVVYRNGIAYYERRARVSGDRLDLRVPGDKIDDFLKSLTVSDAATGQALPVSFPSKSAGIAQDPSSQVAMSIQLPALPTSASREVVLTYVTDAPAWKPSYRVVVDKTGKVSLQGWAIVDNTSGEDWRAVRVGVGSSSALSFRYDLHSIRMVHRETLQTQDTFAKAPPRGGSIYREEEKQQVLGVLADNDIPQQAGAPGTAMLSQSYSMSARARPSKKDKVAAGPMSRAAQAGGMADMAMEAQAAPPRQADDSRVRALAQSLQRRRGTIVIEGYADAGEADGQTRALDRANNLRNQLILQGVAPAQLQVQARGVVAGQRAGVRLVEQAQPEAPQPAAGRDKGHATEDGGPVGESHFESSTAMTVARGTSAMVSIVQGNAPGEVVYLYDAESSAGDARFAFRAVRFKNPTASTLESGPVTVYGDGRFIGEGLTEAIPPGSMAVVPFALDRQVVVEQDNGTGDHIARLIKLQRGVLTAEVQHLRKTKLKLTNRMAERTTLLLRHTVRGGFQLVRSPKLAERYGEAHLFQVELAGHESKTVEIEEATPMTRTLDLRTPVGLDLVRLYLQAPGKDEALIDGLRRLLKIHGELQQYEEQIENLRQRGDEYRVRLDELHGQIVSLRDAKAGGPLIGHLETKMKEISQKVQQNTIAIVDLKEKAMVARVRFQDGMSEVTLDPGAAPASDKKSS